MMIFQRIRKDYGFLDRLQLVKVTAMKSEFSLSMIMK